MPERITAACVDYQLALWPNGIACGTGHRFIECMTRAAKLSPTDLERTETLESELM